MVRLHGSVRQEHVLSCSTDIPDEGQASTLTLPIREHAGDLPVRPFIQGYACTESATRALLVAHLGDATVSAPFAPGADQSYQQELEATLPAGADAQTALFLLAERNDQWQGGI